jgi:hypothetical protein
MLSSYQAKIDLYAPKNLLQQLLSFLVVWKLLKTMPGMLLTRSQAKYVCRIQL